MTTPADLERLFAAAIENREAEPAFFHALLDSVVYVHAALAQRAGYSRFVLFRSPDDGTFVLPVFTDEPKALFAARGNVRVEAINGRALFELTRGTTIMLNPNDTRCTLYPEEISGLLDKGTILPVLKLDPTPDFTTRLYALPALPAAVVRPLKAVLPGISNVDVAYIAGVHGTAPAEPDGLLILLQTDGSAGDRTARAVNIGLNEAIPDPPWVVDIALYTIGEPPAQWVKALGLRPIYRRGPAAPTTPSARLH